MFAAAIYIAQPAGSTGVAQVTAEDAVRGVSPAVLPQGLVEIKISRDGALDRLTVLDGVTGRTTDFDVTATNIADQLAPLEPSLRAASNICIAVFEDAQPVNSEVVLAIQRWLSYSEMGKYQFYFVQPK
jgi:hypothetical protein